ncbi:MAG: triose-phosphate isomerase, partial [Alphaproteobacteria bacterium]|nr:triose-phosphate isomerase [Alphaproteobacteria bacterium]
MSKRRRIAVANWKMYGKLTSGLALARRICTLVEENSPLSYDVVLCPPATLTWSASEVIDGVYSLSIGGQDCHYESYGPYTGDISAAMLSDLGAKFVILGHSERRIAHGETNAFIARKIEAAQFAGLTAILCVGETAEDLNKDSALSV